MNTGIERYSSAHTPDTQGAGTVGATSLTTGQPGDETTDAADDENEASQSNNWKEGDDWDNFGDEEVSDNISETGNSEE